MLQDLYHGSESIIERPVFGAGKPYNDYGLGFYCTTKIEMAKEWGVGKERNGYANCYEIETEELSILNLNDKEYCILNWLAILLVNREFDVSSELALEAKEYIISNFLIDYGSFDIIIGFRADDSYFSFSQDFISGAISYRQLNRAMHLGKLGQQFVLKSEKAFNRIRFKGYEVAEYKEWSKKREFRDSSARREYLDLRRNKRQPGDIYIVQIMDEEMKADDYRLRYTLS